MRRADVLRKRVPAQFGKAVREMRRRAGLSQMKLAEKADLSLAFISDLENGKTVVSLVTVAQLAEAFDLSCEELFGRAEM